MLRAASKDNTTVDYGSVDFTFPKDTVGYVLTDLRMERVRPDGPSAWLPILVPAGGGRGDTTKVPRGIKNTASLLAKQSMTSNEDIIDTLGWETDVRLDSKTLRCYICQYHSDQQRCL